MRTVVRTLIAGVLAIMGASVAGPALAAQAALAVHAQDLYKQSYKTTTATSTSGIAVAIDSLSPRYVSPSTSTIEVKGTVTNHTGGRLAGVQVQLLTTSQPFTSRSLMESYADGGNAFNGTPIYQAVWQDPQTLHTGSTTAWTISFPASAGGFTGFGVFPLTAESSSAAGGSSVARTLLPYWPGSSPGVPTKLDVAWVWPLIDTPQQGACPKALTTNELATSLAPNGRLGGLLGAGLRYSAATKLTWAVDPALLSDAAVMTSPRYKVGGNALCTGTRAMPRSTAASGWLSALKSGTAGDPMFLTGYADPDVSALTHAGLDTDIAQAYTLGNEAASEVLGKSFESGSPIAWPDGGFADDSVLTALYRKGHVSTTVLSSSEMPVSASSANPFEDNAVARVPTGIGTQMNVLLADSEISGLLGSATAHSPVSSQFAVTQDFLAETAMIVAEAPYSQRSVVIAPPSRWDPSASEASTLLSLSSAPWLRPVSLDSLASSRVGTSGVTHDNPPSSRAASQELGQEYLGQVAHVRQMASQFTSLLVQPGQVATQLDVAIAVTQSAAWRGPGSKGGRAAIRRLGDYLDHHEAQVQIVSGSKVLLAGTSGVAPVSVSNGLPDEAIRVRVQAIVPRGSPLSVSSPAPQVIEPNQTVIFRLQVHSAPLGSTFLQLQLQSAEGATLTQSPHTLDVETTRFGRTLLILIAAALGVLVLTSVARWIRRWLRDGGSGHHVSGGGAGGGGTPGDDDGSSGAGGSRADVSGAGWSSASGAGSGSGGTG